MSELIMWRGVRVPWVAQWSAELMDVPFALVGLPPAQSRVMYADEVPTDRDRHGVLWWRQGLTRGGEPRFAQLNAMRQRAAMLKRRCQVCGDKLPEGPVTHWVMAAGQLDDVEGRRVTGNPPTCPDCAPIALGLCPHLLRGGWQVLEVREYRPWGVQGEVAVYDAQGTVIRHPEMRFAYGGAGLRNIVAKQLLVELIDFDVVLDQTRPTG